MQRLIAAISTGEILAGGAPAYGEGLPLKSTTPFSTTAVVFGFALLAGSRRTARPSIGPAHKGALVDTSDHGLTASPARVGRRLGGRVLRASCRRARAGTRRGPAQRGLRPRHRGRGAARKRGQSA